MRWSKYGKVLREVCFLLLHRLKQTNTTIAEPKVCDLAKQDVSCLFLGWKGKAITLIEIVALLF